MSLSDITPGNRTHGGRPLHVLGADPAGARCAVILLHGRGGSGADMLGLAEAIGGPEIVWLAPEARGQVWYPQRFLVPQADNQPDLDDALAMVDGLVARLGGTGLDPARILLAGFSQGACLASQYVLTRPRRWAGLAALSGGLIGTDAEVVRGAGDLSGTPCFLGCSDVDAHIPAGRVRRSAEILAAMGGAVEAILYPGMGHSVNADEIARLRGLLEAVPAR